MQIFIPGPPCRYTALQERPVFLDFSKPDPKKGGQVGEGPGLSMRETELD